MNSIIDSSSETKINGDHEPEKSCDSSVSSLLQMLSDTNVHGSPTSAIHVFEEMRNDDKKDVLMVDGRSDSNTCFYSNRIQEQVREVLKGRKLATVSNDKTIIVSDERATMESRQLSDPDSFQELLYQVLEIRESSSGCGIDDETKLDLSKSESRSDSITFSYPSEMRERESRPVNDATEVPSINPSAKNRLLRDFNRLQFDPPNGVLGAPIDANIMEWRGIVFGLDGTPWEGGIFKVHLEFADHYPFKAPNVVFLTKVFHPNIGPDGEIGLDMLGKGWTPAYDVVDILKSIQNLLCNPNPIYNNSDASALFIQNRLEYNRRVKESVQQSLAHEIRRHSV